MSGAIAIPESFTTGLTSLVNNFGTTIANWLPTIILAWLGVFAIFYLMKVVYRYGRKAFRG